MSDFNPYAAPQADISADAEGHHDDGPGLWRDDGLLRMRKESELPDRCLKCNEPALGYRLKKSLSWHKPVWYLLIFFNVLIYVLVAMCVRWTAKVSAPFCPAHRARRRNAILFGWLGSLAGLGLIACGVLISDYGPISVGVILLPLSLVFGVFRSQLLVPERIDAHFVWLKVSPDFLATLPEWR